MFPQDKCILTWTENIKWAKDNSSVVVFAVWMKKNGAIQFILIQMMSVWVFKEFKHEPFPTALNEAATKVGPSYFIWKSLAQQMKSFVA